LDFSHSLPPDWLGAGFAGVVLLQSLHLFPILYLNASAALANVDPAYAQAARNLGAGPVRAFFRITLPLMRPGLFAGGTIVFIWSFTDIGTPLIVGYNEVLPVTVFKGLARADTGGQTFALVFVMLSSSVALYVLGKFVFGRAIRAESSKASIAAEVHRLSPLATLGAWALFGGVLLAALAPHVGVVLMSVARRWVNTPFPSEYTLDHLAFVLRHPTTYSSIVNSLKYAGLSTAIDIVFGLLIAWLIVRARLRGRTLLDGLAMLPLAVPGLILAAGYVAILAMSKGWLEPGWDFLGSRWMQWWPALRDWFVGLNPIRNPLIVLVVAYSVRRLPFVVRGVSAGLEQVPESLEEAARNLGARRCGAVLRITLPLIAANIIAAGGSPETAYQAAALGVYGMVLLGGTMAIASALLGRRLGAIFRA
jgi:iron(III) transport system permease protein